MPSADYPQVLLAELGALRAQVSDLEAAVVARDLEIAGLKAERDRLVAGARPTELSPEAKAARRPLPPDALVNAEQETVHKETGRSRPARVAPRVRKGGR